LSEQHHRAVRYDQSAFEGGIALFLYNRWQNEGRSAEFLTKPVDFDLLKEQLRQLRRPVESLFVRHRLRAPARATGSERDLWQRARQAPNATCVSMAATRQRCAENAAVECMAEQPEPVFLSAIRTPSDTAIIQRKAIAQRRVLVELIRLSRATLADLVKQE
jgi:hypothetical protein